MKKNYFLLALVILFVGKVNAQPTTSAALPTAKPSNVISLWGNSYTNVAGTNFRPDWGQPTQVVYSKVAGDTTLGYTGLSYEGVSFSSPLDVTNMDSVHYDIWTSNVTSMDIRLINSAAVSGGAPIQPNVTVTLKTNSWNSVTIAVSKFTGLLKSLVDQMSFTGLAPTTGGNIYLQNIYFSSKVTLPTIIGFSVPSNILVGASPFTLTAPKSNSLGAFTYTSSNSAVATVSGSTVTVVGAGTTIISASQAASGIYSSGSASASLVVSYPGPTTSAPMPTQLSSNVISVWGKMYTNLAGTNLRPDWGQPTQLTTLSVGGDTTIEYSALTYEGVQFASLLNVSKAKTFHLDIWTPNTTNLMLKLINSAVVTGAGSIEIADTLTLSKTGWNSFDIPMSAFSGLDFTKLDQMSFTAITPANGGVIYLQNIYFWSTSALPIAINNLKAIKVANTTSISWNTLSEVNNKGFYVQHSNDGVNWTNIQFIASKGNTQSLKNYTVSDVHPTEGNNYYRLAQVDLSGKLIYSSSIVVNFSSYNLSFSFYPNPVRNNLFVNVPSVVSNAASLSLINVNGKVIKTISLSPNSGNSNFSINVNSIAKGYYILVLKDGTSTTSSSVLIN